MTDLLAKKFKYFGRMNAPDASAYLRGICGEEMEFYLELENDFIERIRFYSEGCEYTCMCAEALSGLVDGKEIKEVMGISPAAILEKLPDLPNDHVHCSILSTMAFLKAVSEYVYVRENL